MLHNKLYDLYSHLVLLRQRNLEGYDGLGVYLRWERQGMHTEVW